MLLLTILSKNGIAIRLTDERWVHITQSHPEITTSDASQIGNVVKNPDAILQGDTGELLAVKKKGRKNIWIVVAYKEITSKDGFIITAYITTDYSWLFQRKRIWSKI